MKLISYTRSFLRHFLNNSKKAYFFSVLFLLFSCSPSTNSEFSNAEKINSIEAYKSFLEKYPNSSQVLKARLLLEKLQQSQEPSLFRLNSEANIEVVSKDGSFMDANGSLKQILEFYKSKSKRESFEGVDGIQITYDYFPVEGSKQALIISHGTGESSIRYAEVVYDLVNNKIPYSIFVINHRGHGFSQRMLGKNKNWNPSWNVFDISKDEIQEYKKIYVKDFEDYVKDFGSLVSIIKQKYNFEKITALGHSLGGAVITRYVEHNPEDLESIILSAPMFSIIGLMGADNNDFISKSIISVSDMISSEGYAIGGGGSTFNHLNTTYDTQENTLNFYTTSYNRFYMKKFILQENPETSLGGLTWGFVDAIYEVVKNIRKDAQKIKVPTLIFQAEFDDYVHPSGQNTVCDQINLKSPNLCKLVKVGNAKHELLLERDKVRNQVMSQILESLGNSNESTK